MPDEVVLEFLAESEENLTRLDREIVMLEQHPGDAGLLASIFRTFHTIKGVSGFLDLPILEKLTHQAENVLSHLRGGLIPLTPSVISLLLESADDIRKILLSVEKTGHEPEYDCAASLAQLSGLISGDCMADERDTSGMTIRVDVHLLDTLMRLAEELLLVRNQILQYKEGHEDELFNAAFQRLHKITTQLKECLRKTRMRPIGALWNGLPRMVRDLSQALGKNVALKMEGSETELDRTLIEAIRDPLIHLIRNCCDHGIESPEIRARKGKLAAGTITLRAFHKGGYITVEVTDDGKGIDRAAVTRKAVAEGLVSPEHAESMSGRDALDLIFRPGFSMAEAVTRISGRGVGLDVVKTNIERIGGTVEVSTTVGAGATIRLEIPIA